MEYSLTQAQIECQVIFGVLVDSDIYKAHTEFFDKYHFHNDFFEELSETIKELYSVGIYDIIEVVNSIERKCEIDRSIIKGAIAKGLESVASVKDIDRCIKELEEHREEGNK